MRILHTADIHLGFQAYAKRIEGLNVREHDIYSSWTRLLEEAHKEAPDVMIIAGDLFNNARPSALSYWWAQQVKDLPFPVFIIAGTHDEKRPGGISPVMVLDTIKNVTAVQKPSLEWVKGQSFWLQPWTREQDIHYEDADFFVAHLPITGIPEYAYNQSYTIPHKKYEACFMGDLHRHLIVEDKIIYPGAIERLTFNDEGKDIGYVMWEDGVITFKPLKARELLTLTDPVLDEATLAHCTDKIVRVRLSKEMDLSELYEVAFHIQPEPIRSGTILPEGVKGALGKKLDDQWCEYTAAKQKPEYKEEGAEYLKTAMEKQEV